MAQGIQSLLELLIRSVIEETEGASAGGGVVNNFRHHAVVLAEVQLVSYPDLTGRLHDHVPKPLLLRKFPQKEHYDVSLGLLFLAVKLGGDYFRVVQHEVVSFSEIIYDVLELPVLYFSAVFMKNKETAFVSPTGRFLCDFLLREVEVELRKFHVANID